MSDVQARVRGDEGNLRLLSRLGRVWQQSDVADMIMLPGGGWWMNPDVEVGPEPCVERFPGDTGTRKDGETRGNDGSPASGSSLVSRTAASQRPQSMELNDLKEQTRQKNERTRLDNEETRQLNERNRLKYEQTQKLNQQTRIKNE